MTLDLINRGDEPQVTLDKLNAAIKAVNAKGTIFNNWTKDGMVFTNATMSGGKGYASIDIDEKTKLVAIEFSINKMSDTPTLTIPLSVADNWNGVVKGNSMVANDDNKITAQMNWTTGKMTIWAGKAQIKDASSSINVYAVYLRTEGIYN